MCVCVRVCARVCLRVWVAEWCVRVHFVSLIENWVLNFDFVFGGSATRTPASPASRRVASRHCSTPHWLTDKGANGRTGEGARKGLTDCAGWLFVCGFWHVEFCTLWHHTHTYTRTLAETHPERSVSKLFSHIFLHLGYFFFIFVFPHFFAVRCLVFQSTTLALWGSLSMPPTASLATPPASLCV